MGESGKLVWFAARTRFGQEIGIKDRLDNMGVENFIPVDLRKNTRGKYIRHALINNLVFLKTDKETALELVNLRGMPMNYIIDCATHTMMVVPEKQMSDFMLVFDVSMEEGGALGMELMPGRAVKVIKGPLKGVEGTVIEDEGKTYVSVGLCGFVYARASVPKAWLEVL